MKNKSHQTPAKSQTVTQVQQTESSVLPYQEPYKEQLLLIHRFLGGESGVEKLMRESIARAYADRKLGPQINHEIGKAIVVHGMPSDIFTRILAGLKGDPGTFLKDVTDQLIDCAKQTNLDPPLYDWSLSEKNRAITTWLKMHEQEPSTTINFLAAVTTRPGPRHPFSALEKKWGNRTPRATKEQEAAKLDAKKLALDLEVKITALTKKLAEAKARKVQAAGDDNDDMLAQASADVKQIQDELATLNTELESMDSAQQATTDVENNGAIDDEPLTSTIEEQITTLEAQLAEAKARKVQAASDDNDDALNAASADVKRIQSEIATLRQELVSTTTAPIADPVIPITAPTPETVPVVNKGTNGKMTAEQAEAICKNPEAVTPSTKKQNRLRMVLERWENDDAFGEDDFISTVLDLTGKIATSATA